MMSAIPDDKPACSALEHCWDRFDCIAKGNCQPAAGVPAPGGTAMIDEENPPAAGVKGLGDAQR